MVPGLGAPTGRREVERPVGPSCCLWGQEEGDPFEAALEGTFHNSPYPSPPTGMALTPSESRLRASAPCWLLGLVFTGEVMGAFSSFLFHDKILISLTFSELRGDGSVEASAWARLFLIKSEIGLNDRGLGARWAAGQGPKENCHKTAPSCTTSHSPEPWDVCPDHGETLRNEVLLTLSPGDRISKASAEQEERIWLGFATYTERLSGAPGSGTPQNSQGDDGGVVGTSSSSET